MPTPVIIAIGGVILQAELLDTPCAEAIAATLPLEARPHEWGDEFYFMVPVSLPLDDTATVQVKVGHIGYWPPGPALAIFFGPTPLSTGPDPVPASEVNLVGRILDDATLLRGCRGETSIRMELI